MANEVMSLFGVTPEALQAQREQQAYTQGIQLAQLDPFQRAYAQTYSGASGLGREISGLLGVEDPELKLIRQRQQILQGLDPTDPKSLKAASAKFAAMNDYPAAQMLADKALSTEQSQSTITKNLRPSIGTQTERTRTQIAGYELKLAKGEELTPEEIANARWSIAQETKPKMFRDAESGELITIQPLDLTQAAPNLAKFLGKIATTAEAPVANVPTEVGQTTQVAPGVTVTKTGTGKGLDPSTKAKVADIDANLTKLNSSVSSLSNVGSQINNLDLGLISNWARGAAAWAGLPTADRTSFESLQRTALKEANNLLLLAKGAQTEGDAQRARDQIANPDTWKNKDSLKAAFADLKKTHEDTIAALQASRKTLTSKEPPAAPGTTGGYSQAQESLISRWMSANKRSREEVISYLKSQGKL